MKARVVIDANFGDAGKGSLTDYLCSTEGAGVVVRFNGGSQAGHTVVRPDGRRHVFSHVGSGAFHDIPTYLSEYFICNPIMFFQELDKLKTVGIQPQVFASPACLVTTFVDMMVNQRLESAKGKDRHGSVGLGIFETQHRSENAHLKITMADLWNHKPLEGLLVELCDKYASFRTGTPIENSEAMIEKFLKGCEQFAEYVHPAGIADCASLDPVFEGAQGLLLDQNNKTYFPHVTRSNTGMQNVRELCSKMKITEVEKYYVSRTYLTRHGNGPLPGHDVNMKFEDNTNVPHEYQGVMRFAPLDSDLEKRCANDAQGDFKLVLTHCDQLAPTRKAHLYAYGPTFEDYSKG